MTGILLFFIGVLTLAGIFGILALILNLEAGWAGLWDLGIAGLVAVGAYVYVITTQTRVEDVSLRPGWPTWAGVLAAALAAGLVALIIGVPSLRVRGEYFLITTLAFAEVIRQLTINMSSVTRGTVGFSQLDRPLDQVVTGSEYRFVLLGVVWSVLAVAYWLVRRLGRAPFGRLLRATRDNDPVALSLGKHTNRWRIQTFVLAGVLYGAAAPLYVWFVRSLTPSLFGPEITFVVWTALVVGGIGSMNGPVIGALVLVLLTETLSLFQGSTELAVVLASVRFIVLGLVLILVMRLRPLGLAAERRTFAGASTRFREEKGAIEEAA
jgi:branched-chain amino acid transport system permease protein